MARKNVLVVVGPTSSGKSDLAVYLAKKFNGEVISADSRQVYRGLDIGTGKITKAEMQNVTHHLLDVANPKDSFNASQFKKLGERAIRDVLKRGRIPIIAGGTGFYIDALTSKISLPEIPPNSGFRDKLAQRSTDDLLSELQTRDPIRAHNIDPSNRVRIIRALEIIESLGKVPEPKALKASHNFIYVGLNFNKEELEKKIQQRLLKRMPGMIREAKALHQKGLSYSRMDELGLEYRYLAMYLQKKLTKAEMTEKLFIAIRQYARRQITWFKRNKEIRWFKPSECKEIENYLKEKPIV
jgi:tRNA dimethylallyltransferase